MWEERALNLFCIEMRLRYAAETKKNKPIPSGGSFP
jgi:hypothetical protein